MRSRSITPIFLTAGASAIAVSHHDEASREVPGSTIKQRMIAEKPRDPKSSSSALPLEPRAGTSSSPALMNGFSTPSRPNRRPGLLSPSSLSTAFLSIACLWTQPVSAILIPFSNCLPEKYVHPDPGDNLQLQWVPQYVDAAFDTTNSSHNLQIIVWGNVTGRIGLDPLPPPNSSRWDDPEDVLWAKIRDTPYPELPDGERKATTLHTTVDVLTYDPYVRPTNFCNGLVNASCPLGPVFNNTPYLSPYDEPTSDKPSLPSFNLSHDFGSSYAFTSFAPTFIVLHGDTGSTPIGCISATITPSLEGVAWSLKFVPLLVLLAVGVATVVAAIFSPWGSNDIFLWTTNYGRDPDLLRLVTPGFGDCLQYLQFAVLTASLTLDYPGFFQPVLSQASWSVLMFNQSFVSDQGFESLVDGIYVTNGTFGLERVAQLVGMGEVDDVWAGMIIWLLAIIGAVLVLPQIGFFARWLFRRINHAPEEDRRAKNIPFSIGNVIRVVFNYFLLPIVALSTFQLVVAGQSASVLVGMAVVTLVVIIGFAAWLVYLIATTKPRAHLFDDLPTVLMYGPLYNTYSDEAAAFAMIPIILTIVRGIAIGAVQPSGIAQVVMLAICEVIQMLTLHAFRPFHSPTSMNAYHMGFSLLRFITVILMVTFSSNMGITEGPKGWVGYAILIIHGCVLLFGFLLNSLQTIVEVIARLAGAGGDDVRGQTRGGLSKIFGARQLSRRVDRRGAQSRQSQLSTSAMLDNAAKGAYAYGHVRNGSNASMGNIMHQRNSSMLDARSVDAYSLPLGNFTPTTPGESSFSLPSPGQATRPQPTADPYYRPPRARRGTLNELGSSTPNQGHGSQGSIDLPARANHGGAPGPDDDLEAPNPNPGRAAAAPSAYAPVFAPRADYSTREVDFYYGVRGPALKSDGYGRKLGTGPADPTSPVATATGWLKGLFGGKTKDKGKGFEVVRSARMPPAMRARGGEFGDETPPEGIPVAMGVLRNGPIESDDEDARPKLKRSRSGTVESVKRDLLDEAGDPRGAEDDDARLDIPKIAKEPPLLPDLDAGESFKVPSRIHSKASRNPSQRSVQMPPDSEPAPEVPRKSSKRNSQIDRLSGAEFNLIPPSEDSGSRKHLDIDMQGGGSGPTARLPFDRTNSQKRLSGASSADQDDSQLPSAGMGSSTSDERPTSVGYVHHHNISRVDPDQQVDLLGSTAELVDDPRKRTPSSSAERRPR